MSLEFITQKIVDDATEYADSVVEKAREEAKAITEEYELIAEKDYNHIVDSAYEKANEILHRSSAQGLKEKRIDIMSTKWEYLDSVFSSAVKLMNNVAKDKQVRLLAGLVQQYQRSDAELIFNAGDREKLGQSVVDAVNSASKGFKVTLSKDTGDFSGGLILKEDNIEANLTYETIVTSRREELEDEVSAVLFKEE